MSTVIDRNPTVEALADVPPIISADDHVLEPPDVWTARLPRRYRERAPRVVRDRATLTFRGGKTITGPRGDSNGVWADWWLYEDVEMVLNVMHAAAGLAVSEVDAAPQLYENVRPGCWQQGARLADMDANHVEAAVCFPNVLPRFCGQTFLNAADHDLGLLCVQAYNDWLIDEWCAGAARGRLIPVTLVPLWDPALAAAEVHRCAEKGSHAISFTENPHALGLPSLHEPSRPWDALLQACEETDSVLCMHIGSSSRQLSTSPDAPHAVGSALFFQNTAGALVDHIVSGTFVRFPRLKVVLAEGQVGWMPYVLERLDVLWSGRDRDAMIGVKLDNPPSSYVDGHVYSCVFDDTVGLAISDRVGARQIMFETDFPHSDGTFPYSRDVAHRIAVAAGMSPAELSDFVRGNAVDAFGLERFGIIRDLSPSKHNYKS